MATKGQLYQAAIFFLTFLSYASYTLLRQCVPIVKSTLHPDPEKDPDEPGWAPFNGSNGGLYLGALDTTFLTAYAISLFFSGAIGDRVNLRYFMGLGLLGASAFVVLFGMGYFWAIHNFYYFAMCMVVAGVFQSTGWPSNVTLMSRWFPKSTRGTIMGFWNAHSSIGNILGKVVAAAALHQLGWAWAFIIPGIFVGVVAFIEYFFLVPTPTDVFSPSEASEQLGLDPQEIKQHENLDSYPSISLWQALLVPGVVAYSICLFFSKLVAYSFVFWLPFYLDHIGYGKDSAGNWSVIYDVGGVVGGIIAGYASDRLGKRGIVSFVMLLLTVPGLWLYSAIASSGDVANGFGMFLVGVLVNGPYTLISSAVSADLGSHASLKGNPKAMATVTGIIDGTGSIGSAVQGVMIGWVSDSLGWTWVFYMLMIMCVISALMIVRVVIAEHRRPVYVEVVSSIQSPPALHTVILQSDTAITPMPTPDASSYDNSALSFDNSAGASPNSAVGFISPSHRVFDDDDDHDHLHNVQ